MVNDDLPYSIFGINRRQSVLAPLVSGFASCGRGVVRAND